MKFNEITETASAGSTSSGSVAPVVAPLGKTHTRKGGNLLTGKRSKGKYANSVEARKQMNLKEANVTEEDEYESVDEFKDKICCKVHEWIILIKKNKRNIRNS